MVHHGEHEMLKGVLLDLGGVVYEGDALLPGSWGAIARLKAGGLAVRYLTNITRQSRDVLRGKLESMGLDVAEYELFMPAIAARRYLLKQGLKPLLLVHSALLSEFKGLPNDGPEAVVIGDAGNDFTYASLNRAYRSCQRRSKISPPGRSKTSPLNVMRYAVLGGCPGSP